MDAAASVGAVLDAASELLRQLREVVDCPFAVCPQAHAADALAVAAGNGEHQTIEIPPHDAAFGPAGPENRKQGAP